MTNTRTTFYQAGLPTTPSARIFVGLSFLVRTLFGNTFTHLNA